MPSAPSILLLSLTIAANARAAEPAPPVGRVVLIGELDAGAARRGARQAGGAQWEVIALRPQPAAAPPTPSADLDRLRTLYMEADFVGCLAHMQRGSLDLDGLLARGQRDAAARAAILGAACAHDAGDPDLARRLLMRVLDAELDTAALADTKPAVQSTMETLQAASKQTPRVRLSLTTRPKGARAAIDGRAASCPHTPCEIALRPGHHVVVLRALGYLSRRLTLDLDRSTSRAVSLDRAPAGAARRQLAAHLAAGGPPDRRDVAATAAEAFAARTVVVVHARQRRLAAALYDRKLGKIVARTALKEQPGALARCVQAVIEEWRSKVEPTPLYKRPLFWGITIATVAATAATVFLLTRPTERVYVLEVPSN